MFFLNLYLKNCGSQTSPASSDVMWIETPVSNDTSATIENDQGIADPRTPDYNPPETPAVEMVDIVTVDVTSTIIEAPESDDSAVHDRLSRILDAIDVSAADLPIK